MDPIVGACNWAYINSLAVRRNHQFVGSGNDLYIDDLSLEYITLFTGSRVMKLGLRVSLYNQNSNSCVRQIFVCSGVTVRFDQLSNFTVYGLPVSASNILCMRVS